MTVVSVSSARKAARRGAKISTGFHPLSKVIEIFDAYRDEADKAGRKARPDDLCIRRQVTMLEDDRERQGNYGPAGTGSSAKVLVVDPRVTPPSAPRCWTRPARTPFPSATRSLSRARPPRWRRISSSNAGALGLVISPRSSAALYSRSNRRSGITTSVWNDPASARGRNLKFPRR